MAGDVPLAEVDAALRALRELAAAGGAGRAPSPSLGAVRSAAVAYRAAMVAAGLDDRVDDRLVASARSARSTPAVQLASTALVVASGAPMALPGAVVHAVPYEAIKRLARRPANRSMRATVKLLGCFTAFNAVYVVAAVLVGRRRGWRAGLAAFVAGPLSGWITLRYAEAVHRRGASVALTRRLRRFGGALPPLVAQREALRAGALDLLAGTEDRPV